MSFDYLGTCDETLKTTIDPPFDIRSAGFIIIFQRLQRDGARQRTLQGKNSTSFIRHHSLE